ncbi:1-(5-phosphoribosyl)-5-[(5-phosphoribosylamino) methylideneamino] imidazole-4-carboxamide isomerase [Buchnera aphidicola (Nipponaphis monzeni)]|uniref:1-(5-phosphoribosyl)-5-[(5-phosphoribosylamino)methylideneamino] imidazole-4-carboxamide isomerase n=1 Tax=Buchnera aphidicola (Nipponaphis monzeni) TaxID=2495405 RepID=A0A455T9U4_9GAMM|nr:1-(5-phosphoribosyl)-5-[(5-phosphoribosylamino)methylideneamino]imidazole-4-carboxamide isomerase [Buchnera aphidicola]BBI01102.1 1-(5-phosphoribosyl)-5-[(5-phosphoribosylamino) methylideneamino] imidazole-4-carboxamide isomerase [Buchnera aphidicola (Nipponaphis monzeni)]
MIIPALDLFNGKVVRLYKGNYQKMKFYSHTIEFFLEKYKSSQINYLHIVDLNGALNPNTNQFNLLSKLAKNTNISLQVGGGIRTNANIEKLLLSGIKRIVVSSAAITNNQNLKNWLSYYGSNSIVLALDLKINTNNLKEIYTHAWKKSTGITLETLISQYSEFGLKHVLCTDISKDGTLNGPNIKLYNEIARLFKHIHFQASGGVGSLTDIIALKKTNVQDIIIGKALLEKKFNLQEAIKCWQSASFHV